MAKGFVGMLFSYIHRDFGLPYRFDFSSKRISRKASGFIFAIIVIAHGILIILVLNSKSKLREYRVTETLLQLVDLPPEEYQPLVEPEKPIVSFHLTANHNELPNIDIKNAPVEKADLTNYQSSVPYELPNKNDKLYSDVFDPVLRKKLQEAHANRKPKKQNTLNTWETSGGTTLADMGDGECIASMPTIDSRQRGTSWSMLRVKCGKTDSEKMMDNIMTDLEARKHPLQTQ